MQEIMQFASNNPILSLAWVILLVLVIVTTAKGMFSKVKTITRGEATHLMNKEDAVIVDVRGRDEFRKGHISNSVNVQAADIKKGSFSELEKYKSQPLIVVCASGHTAHESATKLSQAGFEKVSVMKDGISGWNGDNLPLVRGK
ncbi:rhodanese-like domain-containing protein [Enterobacterales bacterium CwR94]|nr:rhodanese-like domain-containing protein [Enterobacterales bacterium CwR94]